MEIEFEIIKLKAEVFDLIMAQSQRKMEIDTLEKVKNEKIQEINMKLSTIQANKNQQDNNIDNKE